MNLKFITTFFKFIFKKLFNSGAPYLKVKNQSIKSINNSGSIQQAGRDIVFAHPQRPKIDLDGNMPVSSGQAGKWINFKVINMGNDVAVDIKFYLSYDDTKTEFSSACSKLLPSEKSDSKEFYYNNTDIFKKKVDNLKINFIYKDTDGHSYHSGRNLKQNNRNDGNYDINGLIDEYFDSDQKEKQKKWEAEKNLSIKKAELEKLKRDYYKATANKLVGISDETNNIDFEFEEQKIQAEIEHLEKLIKNE